MAAGPLELESGHQARFSSFETSGWQLHCHVRDRVPPAAWVKYPSGTDRMALTDWPLHVPDARNGRIGYIDEVWVYIDTNGGAYNPATEWTSSKELCSSICR